MKKARFVVALVVSVLVLGSVLLITYFVFRRSAVAGPSCRIEMVFRMCDNEVTISAVDIRRVTAVVGRVIEENHLLFIEKDRKLKVIVTVPCSNAGPQEVAVDAAKAVQRYRRILEGVGSLGLHHVDACQTYQYDERRWERARAGEKVPGYVLKKYVWSHTNRAGSEDLLLEEKPFIDGSRVDLALVGLGDRGPEVQIRLTPAGMVRMAANTSDSRIRHGKDRVAVVLNDEVRIAPIIESQMGAFLKIAGRLTSSEAEDIARVLNAGVLPCRLKMVSSRLLKEEEKPAPQLRGRR